MSKTADVVHEIYDRLMSAYGRQGWWPGDSDTETVVGAILTQNTAWTNVERALANLRKASAVDWAVLRDLSDAKIAEMIRPAGTFRVKTLRLRAFVSTLWSQHAGSLGNMLSGDLAEVRNRLLAIHGIGPETADAILVYAGHRPSFVVDAYTRRVLRRHGLVTPDESRSYEIVQRVFHRSLEPDAEMFNEYHALLVKVAKRHCRNRATCAGCPLVELPHDESL